MHWLNSIQTTLSLQYDDAAATTQDVTDQWSDPLKLEGEKAWVSQLYSPTLDLAAGETVLVTVVTSWTSPTLDRYPDELPTLDPDGETLVDTCRITAV